MSSSGRTHLWFPVGAMILYTTLAGAQASIGSSTIPDAPVAPASTTVSTPPGNSPATQAGTGSLAESEITLEQLVSIALHRNPAIRSAAERFQAQQARAPQARSLPDPMVSGGWMGNVTPFSVQYGDPSSYRGISVSQDFPYPGKLALRGKVADRQAEAGQWEYEQTRRQVVADVKGAYYA